MKPVHWNSELPWEFNGYKAPQSKFLCIQSTE